MASRLRREVVRAAGGVVRRVGDAGPEVLLVHRPRYDDWTFPKGKAEPGETDDETALREVEEEAGLRCVLGRELPTTRYRDSRGRDKQVRYWTMVVAAGEFEPRGEVDEIEWLIPELAGFKLSYERDLGVLSAVPDPLLVVRHASAGDSAAWIGDDALRPLDERGRRQAAALVDQLAPYSIERIISSPFVRCVQSVEPLAAARALELELRDELAEGSDPERVRALLGELDSEAVACMHGPELAPLFGDVKKAATVPVEVAGDRLLELGRLRSSG
ncbi:MAG TPA: NUDIX hydrolase [Gaiellaceae bacterium]|nr:NUDIX hydrolase [Gaiellaceae bacterium]